MRAYTPPGNSSSGQPVVSRGWVGASSFRDPTYVFSSLFFCIDLTLTRHSPCPSSHGPAKSTERPSSRASHSSDTGAETSDYGSSSYAARTYSQTIRTRTRLSYRSTSSATSDDEDNADPAAGHANGHSLIRSAAPPPLVDTSGWESAFIDSLPAKKRNKLQQDAAQLAKDIDELGLDKNLNAKAAPRAGLVGKHTAVPEFIPPPPSDSAWSFKKTLNVSRGSVVPPQYLKAPTSDYLSISNRASESQHPSMLRERRPKLIILDLNNTLVARRKATSKGANNAAPRPYLSTFLEYLCGSELVDGQLQRRFNVMIWSSAQADSVQLMCEKLSLFSNAGQQTPLLVDIWDRSSMDLTDEQYNSKFPTVKDVSKVWKSLAWTPPSAVKPPDAADELSSVSSSALSNGDTEEPKGKNWSYEHLHWTQYDTILVDDAPDKACLQPHNHMQISAYKPYNINVAAAGPGAAMKDNALLQLVAMLEKLKSHSNVSAAIRSGIFAGLGRGGVASDWAHKGKDILIRKGIIVTENFDRAWADRVLGVS